MLTVIELGLEFFLGCNISALQAVTTLHIYYSYIPIESALIITSQYFIMLIFCYIYLLNFPIQITVKFLLSIGPLTITHTKSNVRLNLKVN